MYHICLDKHLVHVYRIRSALKNMRSVYSKHWCTMTLCMLGKFSCFCCCLLSFLKITFSKNYFRKIIRVSNCLEPDQDRHCVGPDLILNYLLRLSEKSLSEFIVCIMYNIPTQFHQCRLLVAFANSLDPDQALPNIKTVWFSDGIPERSFWKVDFEKN